MNTPSLPGYAKHPSQRRFAVALGLVHLALATSAAAGVCSTTADLTFRACGFEGRDDELIGRAKCLQISDSTARAECNGEVADERDEHTAECAAMRDARLNVCSQVGPGRYDPQYDPALFDSDYRNPTNPNPYFPLTIGNTWEYMTPEEDERNTVTATDETKRIEGLNCIVFRDKVFEKGRLHEATDDWYCQARNGDVHYLGEEVKNFENFAGDHPRRPELVSIDGSFKSGRDRNKGGIILPFDLQVGASYFEEFALGDAEDTAQILSTSYRYGDDPKLDKKVPKALANHLCANSDCVVTQNTSQIEPGVTDRKYYALGIGFFLEVHVDTGVVDRLTGCNFDPRCDTVPQP